MARLVCDPQEGVDYYEVTIDGETQIVDAIDTRLDLDVTNVTEGDHICEVAACNEWGCSTPTPFDFTKALPSAPTGVAIIG